MKKAFKIFLIIGICLTLVGGIIFTVAMSVAGWDFSVLSNAVAEKKRYAVAADEVQSVSIELSTTDIRIVRTDEQDYSLAYYNTLTKKGKTVSVCTPKVENGILSIKTTWHFSPTTFSFDEEPFVLKIPQSENIPVKVRTSTGDITIGETGKAETYPSLQLQTSTGGILLSSAITIETDCKLTVNTGNIRVDGKLVCGGKAELETDTGDIRINAPFQATSVDFETDTGDLYCNASIDAQSVQASADTGDIVLRLLGNKNEYSYDYETDTGKSNLPPFVGGEKRIRVETDTGDITITFTE